ncbi:carbohydrate ABC transporter permease [Cellulosimicrobium cellulans]|uniref:carbohydrate ABC transporter permease n=1 Tax=Cellulosimicrobium cellulans TaxID=1710 RepID=UPI00130E38C4|nr:sugar ABC transporter permease [Cellulosimicrobium cellulans]
MFVTLDPPAAAGSAAPAEEAAGPVLAASSAGRRAARRLVPYLYLLPAVVLLVVWVYKPLVETFRLSVYDWNLVPTSPMTFVGAQNYADGLALPELHDALRNTLLYTGAFLVFSVVFPLVFALVARRVTGRARTVYQALIFVPYLITPVATSAVWRWLFAEEGGALTETLRSAGIEIGNVFRDPSTVIWAVIVIVGWQMLGFGVLVVSAGLAGINPDYASAASMDGAGAGTITWRITLPLLSPTLVFLGLMTILLSAQWTYPVIDILTQGGPGTASTNIYYLLYQFGFRNFDAGLSAAAGTIFFVGFGIVAAVFVELSERLSFYDN